MRHSCRLFLFFALGITLFVTQGKAQEREAQDFLRFEIGGSSFLRRGQDALDTCRSTVCSTWTPGIGWAPQEALTNRFFLGAFAVVSPSFACKTIDSQSRCTERVWFWIVDAGARATWELNSFVAFRGGAGVQSWLFAKGDQKSTTGALAVVGVEVQPNFLPLFAVESFFFEIGHALTKPRATALRGGIVVNF